MGREHDNPFELFMDEQYVACVGGESYLDDQTIFSGYVEAAKILASNVRHVGIALDEIVYPIVYCCRHSIELGLKIVLKNIMQICVIKHYLPYVQDNRKVINTHSIRKLNRLIKDMPILDKRISKPYSEIEEYIKDYYFDEEGVAFKYTLDREGNPILQNKKIGRISMGRLLMKYKTVSSRLQTLIGELNYLVDEYSVGTFTKHLSRADIESISNELPNHCFWKEECFDAIKDTIKTKYSISSTELSKAIKIIREHQFFSANIGLEKIMGKITDAELVVYADYCVGYENDNKKHNEKAVQLDNIDLVWCQKKYKEMTEKLKDLSTESAKLLMAFIEAGKNSDFLVEQFDYGLDVMDQQEYRIDLLSRIVDYKNAIKGMEKCGQITYSNKLNKFLSAEKK